MPIVEVGSWQGFLTSKGTPPAMAARLNDEIKKILAMPDIAKKITELGGDVRTSATPDGIRHLAHQGDRRLGRGGEGGGHPGRRLVDDDLALPRSGEACGRSRRARSPMTLRLNVPDLAFAAFLVALGALAFALASELTRRHRGRDGSGLRAARARAAHHGLRRWCSACAPRSPAAQPFPAIAWRPLLLISASVALFAILLPVGGPRADEPRRS